MVEILQCSSCKTFTMNVHCSCGGSAITIIPVKYSPQDKYGGYRRQAKEAEWRKQGLI